MKTKKWGKMRQWWKNERMIMSDEVEDKVNEQENEGKRRRQFLVVSDNKRVQLVKLTC